MTITGLLTFVALLHSGLEKPPEYVPHHYTMQEGLIFDNVNSIAQDHVGFIWMATDDGLSRFDGKTFQNIKYDTRTPDGLAGNYVAQLYTDPKGDLWVTSRNGISKYDVSKESFVHYQLLTPQKGRYKTDVSSINGASTAHELWVSANGLGLYRFNTITGDFKRYTTENLFGLNSNMITYVFEDSHGLLWVGTQDNGVQVFAIQPGGLVLYEPLNALQEANKYTRVHQIYEDSEKDIWVTTDNGLLYCNVQTANYTWFNAAELGLPSNRFLSVISDNHGYVFFGLQDGGVYRFKISRKAAIKLVKSPFVSDTNHKACLTNRSVPSLFFDRAGNLWAGTSGDGVFLSAKPKYNFENFRHTKAPSTESWDGMRFYGLTEDSDGNLFIGTDGHGIFKFDKTDRFVTRYTANNRGGSMTDNAILYAYHDCKNRAWFGTYNGGLLLYQPITDDFKSYRFDPKEEGFLGGNDVRIIFEDRNGQLWIGTNGGGLNKLNEGTGKFSRYLQTNSNIPSNDIRAIAEDQEGLLIIGTYGAGITFFDPKKEQFGQLPNNELYELLASEVIFALRVSDDGKLWIATESLGLLVYDLKIRRVIHHFDEHHGLASNTVFSIQFDNHRHCWTSTNKGLSKIIPHTGQVFNYGRSSGIQSGIFNPNATLYSRFRNQLFFGGTGGLTHFDPLTVTSDTFMQPVTLTGVEIFGQRVRVGKPEEHVIMERALNDVAIIRLKPSQSTFTLNYSSLEYGYADGQNFAYKLNGLDNDWNFVKGQQSATYRYLSPGRYTFMVGIESGGRVSEGSIKTLEIVVLPPWYQTKWAYIGYFAIGCFIFHYYRKYRKQREKLKYQLAISQIERAKEREWNDLKINFYTRLSHEFRSSLTLILNPVKDLLNSGPPPQFEPYVNTLHANTSRLLRLADQALSIRKDDLITENVLWEEVDIVQLANDVLNCFTNQAAKKNISITLHTQEEQLFIKADREKLEIIIFNLVFNAVKFTNQGGVSLGIKRLNERLEITVADTGCGIADSVGPRLFEQFYQESASDSNVPKGFGVGLWMVKSLVELHEGKITYQSEKGLGTTFTMFLPQNTATTAPTKLATKEIAPHKDIARKIMKVPKPHKILIVEDDIELALYLKSLFEEDYGVWLTDNESEALTIVEKELPDIICCDMMLATGNGMDFCRTVKQTNNWKHIPILLITAAKGADVQINSIESGADDFLAKPFDKGVLQAKVNALLQRGKNLREYFFNNITDVMGYQKVSYEDKVLLDKCVSIIEAHLEDERFSVHVLADQCGMTYATLSNRIKEINQQTLNTLIRTVRLHKAAQLLLTTDNTIYEVAYKVGIKDLKYFREQFAKLYTLNPSDFIRKYRKPFHEIHHPN
ncbi:hybrid sensor histidine kinase/response regulator transcription factor [Parapedobacter tibetensis]|uniref:hybrid sensor histidine kinase/response regulator transcription factor n=1 Tax=Parapedobacter tibetensis TaxID=2972951 RepID=UPI00214D218A|nr:hybrid sensor histidine kinase/response regulator transcription factor [Parapedobacter tibetensis]